MRGKLKKLFAAVLAVLLALSFSGCSELTGLDAQALMSPPKTTADREAIYALMGGGVGDVTLVYPKYGDYRSAIISRDVNKDGILEIPTAELTINGSETTADSTGYVITWNTYSLQDNTLTPVCTSILNTAENYNLFLPSSEDNYGCQNDTVTRTATFFTYTQIGFNGNYLGREDKFSIRVYTEEDWAEKEQNDEDILLSSSAGRVYVLRILDDSMAESDEKTLQSGFEVLE